MRRGIWGFGGLLALVAVATLPVAAGTAEWTGGLPEGGSIRSAAHDPTSSGRVLIGPSLNGVYRSQDGGASWAASRSGLTLDSFRLGVGPDGVFYAAAEQCCWDVVIFRSTDGGLSWFDVSPATAGLDLQAFAVDPTDSDIAYFTTQDAGVFRTLDGGANWSPINNGLTSPPPYLEAIAIDPNDPQVLYLSETAFIYQSIDRGSTWTQVNSSFVPRFRELAVDLNDPNTLLGASSSGLYRSQDGGVNWVVVATGRTRSIAIDPAVAGHYLVGTDDTILRSTDEGDSWTDTSPAKPLGSVDAISFDPFVATRVVAASGIGPMLSTASGTSWLPQVSGLDTYDASAIASPPLMPSRVVTADGFDPGIFRSTNAGASWNQVEEVFEPWPLKSASTDPSRFYGVTTYSPFWSLSDIVRSDDGGATWQAVIQDGLAFGPIGPVVMDVGVHPQDPDTVIALNYAIDIGASELPPVILRSTDGGVNWEELYRASITNYFSAFPFGIAIDRGDPDRMLVGVSRIPNQAPREGVIMRTVDGGQTWGEADLGGDYWITSIAFDAVDPQTAYASTWEWNTTNDDFFKTTDGGVTWTEIPIPFACMNHLAADPRRSGHLYAGCDKVYRSTDGGATWEAVDEESFPDLRAVTWVSVSATSPRVIHAGTTQGVFSNTTGIDLAVTGSCPGTVTFTVTNAPPNSEVGVVAAANNNGFVKQSGLCAGVEVEVSEPFHKPATFVKVDGLGNGSAQATAPPNRCFFEALSFKNCTASGARQVP